MWYSRDAQSERLYINDQNGLISKYMNKKTVLITGAGTGIGKATAELFAKKGWQVIATMRDPDRYAKDFTDDNYYLLAVDVSKPDTIRTAIAEVKKLFNHIDVVVNNAGYGLYGAFEMLTPEEVQQQYDVNVFGVMNMCREVIPVLRDQGNGTIVNISSMGGKFTIPYYSVYNSTKFAIEGFTEGLWYELQQFGITMKMVEPGAINTDFYSRSKKVGTRSDYASLYTAIVDTLWNQYGSAGVRGSNAQLVAKTIYKAANSKSKRLRYAVGRDAHINIWMYKFLPHTLAMKLAKMMTVDRA